jgi:hypothetical protein
MPCTYTGSLEGDAALCAEEARKKAATSLTKTTAMLCATLKIVERYDVYDSLPKNVKKFWREHKKIDGR